jgi:hypothetical protein
MVYQTIALNVAVNSYDHALLTLLVSNQFVEIKGSVFKKFEKDNLFQIMCAGTSGSLLPNICVNRIVFRYRRTLHARNDALRRRISQLDRACWL